LTAPVDEEPLVDLLPDHAPEAVHDAALVADQVSVELPPAVTVLGLALSATVGVAEATDTVADCTASRPDSPQVNV